MAKLSDGFAGSTTRGMSKVDREVEARLGSGPLDPEALRESDNGVQRGSYPDSESVTWTPDDRVEQRMKAILARGKKG